MNSLPHTISTGDPTRPIVADPQQIVSHREPAFWHLSLFIIIAGLCLFVIELTGFPDLSDNERRIGSYALDMVQNGRWFAPRDLTGEVITKPPAFAWLVALGMIGTKELSLFALYWPTAAATVLTSLILLSWGRTYFGWQAGIIAAFSYLFSPIGHDQMMTARYDGLLALAVTFGAWAAFRAWTMQKSWTWFWLAAAFGTLVKGPIAIVLGASGLLALIWEKLTGNSVALRGKHWWGVLLFLGVCGSWLGLAYLEAGPALMQILFGKELAGALAGEREQTMLSGLFQPPGFFIGQYIPWSIIAILAFWRVWRRPAVDADERRLERFLTCWFVLGMLIFCVAAHQRARLITPLVPAAALLVGREIARWLRAAPVLRIAEGATAVALVILLFLHHGWQKDHRGVRATLGMQELAGQVRRTFGEEFPLVHVHTPFALQFYLKTAWPYVSPERAATLLQGDFPAYVAVTGDEKVSAHLKPGVELKELSRWPAEGSPQVRIIGNRAASESAARLATLCGPFLIQMEDMQLVKVADTQFTFHCTTDSKKVRFENQSPDKQTVTVRFISAGSSRVESFQRTLLPNEGWNFSPRS